MSGARRSGVPRCAELPILGFTDSMSANRNIAKSSNGLIAAPSGGTFMGREQNGESRLIRRMAPAGAPSCDFLEDS